MYRPKPLVTRALLSALALSTPLAAAAIALLFTGQVGLGPAVGLWLVATAGMAVMLRRSLNELAEAAGFFSRIADGGTALTPRLTSIIGGEEMETVGIRLQRRLQDLMATAEDAGMLAVAVLDALPDPVLQLSAERSITRTNRAARDLFGDGIEGRSLTQVLRSPPVQEAVDMVLGGAVSQSVEFSMPSPVEREFACRVVRLPQPARDGTHVVLSLRDFTEQRRTEQMRADFVANASHEIRTPLATLSGCIETLQGPGRDDDEAIDRFLQIMATQSTRMTRLVEDLLSLSRIELNEHTPPTGAVDLRAVIDRVTDGLTLKADAAKVRVDIDIAADLPPALGDMNEVEQVMQNLVDNAIKYGGRGRVRIEALRADRALPGITGRENALMIRIQDEGPGIAREHLPRLTERFYRIDTARSRELGGTGLGLAIVKHIVNRHRGVLTVDSRPGEGSTFTVYLPAAA